MKKMLELIVFFGIPLIIAFCTSRWRFERAWIFFCSALLAGCTVFGLQPYVIEKLLQYLPESGRGWVSLIALPGAGLILMIILCAAFSQMFPPDNRHISYPTHISMALRFLCVYGGALVCMAVLTLGLSSVALVDKIPLVSQPNVLRFSNLVLPRMIRTVQCGTPQTPAQAVWMEQYPTILYLANGGSFKESAPVSDPEKKNGDGEAPTAKPEKKAAQENSNAVSSRETLENLISALKKN